MADQDQRELDRSTDTSAAGPVLRDGLQLIGDDVLDTVEGGNEGAPPHPKSAPRETKKQQSFDHAANAVAGHLGPTTLGGPAVPHHEGSMPAPHQPVMPAPHPTAPHGTTAGPHEGPTGAPAHLTPHPGTEGPHAGTRSPGTEGTHQGSEHGPVIHTDPHPKPASQPHSPQAPHERGPVIPGTPTHAPQTGHTGDPASTHPHSIAAGQQHSELWRAARQENAGAFGTLKNLYHRVTGTPEVPKHFADSGNLPPHLQKAVTDASGDWRKVLTGTHGDLDRQLLRATYEKNYYKEPLMGYANKDKFVAKYGENATDHELRKLSPADRIEYVAKYGQQSADHRDAQANAKLQSQIEEMRAAQKQNQTSAAHQDLEKARDSVKQALHDEKAKISNDKPTQPHDPKPSTPPVTPTTPGTKEPGTPYTPADIKSLFGNKANSAGQVEPPKRFADVLRAQGYNEDAIQNIQKIRKGDKEPQLDKEPLDPGKGASHDERWAYYAKEAAWVERNFNPKSGQPVNQHYAADWIIKGGGIEHPSEGNRPQTRQEANSEKETHNWRNSSDYKRTKDSQEYEKPNKPVDPKDWDGIKRPQAGPEQGSGGDTHVHGHYSSNEIKDLFKSDKGNANDIKPPAHEAEVLRKLGYGQNAIDEIKSVRNHSAPINDAMPQKPPANATDEQKWTYYRKLTGWIERNFDKSTGKAIGNVRGSGIDWQPHKDSQHARLEPGDPGYDATRDPHSPQFKMTDAFKEHLDKYEQEHGRAPYQWERTANGDWKRKDPVTPTRGDGGNPSSPTGGGGTAHKPGEGGSPPHTTPKDQGNPNPAQDAHQGGAAPGPAPVIPQYSTADVTAKFGDKIPKNTQDILKSYGYSDKTAEHLSKMRQAGYGPPADPLPSKPGDNATAADRLKYATDVANWAARNVDPQTGRPIGSAWKSVDPAKLDAEQTRCDLRRLYGTADLDKLQKINPTAYDYVQKNPGELKRYEAAKTYGMWAKQMGKAAADSKFAQVVKEAASEVASELVQDAVINAAGL